MLHVSALFETNSIDTVRRRLFHVYESQQFLSVGSGRLQRTDAIIGGNHWCFFIYYRSILHHRCHLSTIVWISCNQVIACRNSATDIQLLMRKKIVNSRDCRVIFFDPATILLLPFSWLIWRLQGFHFWDLSDL